MIKTLQILIAALILGNCYNSQAQEEIVLASKYGVTISYQLLLEDEGKRKDKYILLLNTVNESENDLYYEVDARIAMQDQQGTLLNKNPVNFAKIKVRNSSGLFGDGVSVVGEITDLITTNNTRLYKIGSGEILHSETTFKVSSGKKPLITNSFQKTFKTLSEFELMISSAMLDGDYKSSCGNISVNIASGTDPVKGDLIVQTVNGKQFVWLRTTDTTFVREDNDGYTLSFNQDKGTFLYSTSDGISCTWEK